MELLYHFKIHALLDITVRLELLHNFKIHVEPEHTVQINDKHRQHHVQLDHSARAVQI
jgi:hypothetical protein